MQNAMVGGAGCVTVYGIGVGIFVVVVRRGSWRWILVTYEDCGEGNVQVWRCWYWDIKIYLTVLEVGDLDGGQIGMTRRVSWRVAVLY